MEVDWPASVKKPTIDGWIPAFACGHYGMANWLDCPFSLPEANLFPQKCRDENIRNSIGINGYYPIVDRNRGYWMHIVTHGPTVEQMLMS